MTYFLGISVKQGLVAIADTRITSGTKKTTKKKPRRAKGKSFFVYNDEWLAVGA
jgi:putative proteasome-type protease